ncbi:MAG: hypothetical protein H6716_08965 [Polyangiaceae bacterium]|nr:hypothetical protein [Polyangiaceae bacterium]
MVRRRTFHPKVYLALFDEEAWLAIGSGNLTKSGLEQNTELFFFRTLRYSEPADATLLREVDAFLGQCAELAATQGSQLPLIRQTLANRLSGHVPDEGASRDVGFVSTFGPSLLEQLNAVIASSARITRVGVLAPFFEQDDLAVSDEQAGMHAVLGKLLALRSGSNIQFDVGVPWDDAPLASPPYGELPTFDGSVGSLWGWRRLEESADGKVERMDYFTLTSASAKRIEAINAAGKSCRFERSECERAIADHRLWPVSRPTVHAPRRILQRIAAEYPVSLWLHPTSQLSAGHAQRRPLHAKAVLVTADVGRKTYTYALLGSANASRAALDRGFEQAGNVEACVLCRFDGEITLNDLLPSLVAYELNGVELVERESMETEVDLSAWIDDVVYDAENRTLEVTWRSEGPASLGDWELRYLERSLAKGDGAPTSPMLVRDFDLSATSAELTFVSAGREWQVPIRVLDLAALPTNPLLTQLGLRELLALLGRRVGAERLATLKLQRGIEGLSSVLDAVFGEGFGPTDVFKAWWGAAEDLKLAATIAAFRFRLSGPTGVLTVWRHLREVPEEQLSADEVWVYGCELLRELKAVELPDGADTPTKQALLDEAARELAAELDERSPQSSARPWLSAVREFYGFGGEV